MRNWLARHCSQPAVRRSAALAALGLTLSAGCALKKPPDAAAIKEEALPGLMLPGQWTAAGAGAGMVADNWLVTFGDNQLNAAVAEAIARNADLRVGAARVEQALLYAKLAGAKLYPSVDFFARGGGKLSGDGSGIQGGVLSLSWELDLWGRVRYGRAAAAADAQSAQADFEYARQSIAALVARSWFLATEAGLQAELARQTVGRGEELVRLAETRSRVGIGNDEDVEVAQANVGTYRDALRQLELARELALRSLEILIGRYPAAAAAVSAQLPGQPGAVPAGLPSELLERRPDVVAAERRIAAAFNRIGEAKAARLPTIALTTGVSAISSELFVLKDHDNPVWNIGASLLAPIYRGGALKTQVEIRTVEQKQAVAAYASIGLRAFGEVENALASEIAARDRERILTETLSHSQRALDIVQTQYKVGSTDLRFVTERQLALNVTSAALIRMQAEQRVQRVNLHLALGGSFEPRPEPPPGTPAAEQEKKK
jgi:NodT family efflux transporter outer membrane factor (OMF) lipoprotein